MRAIQGAAVFSGDESRLQRVTHHIEAGIVWQNCSQPTLVEAPWYSNQCYFYICFKVQCFINNQINKSCNWLIFNTVSFKIKQGRCQEQWHWSRIGTMGTYSIIMHFRSYYANVSSLMLLDIIISVKLF